MLERLAKALRGSGGPAAAAGAVATQDPLSDAPLSWEQLGEACTGLEAEVGAKFDDPEDPRGPMQSKSLLQLFGGDTEADVRVVLYRDTAAWCPYCAKVWLYLFERRISFRVVKVPLRCYGDKPASFLAKVPSGMLPAVELDGQLLTESDAIMRTLEDVFPDNKLLPPAGSKDAAVARDMLRLERQLFSRWMQWLTSSWANEQGRESFEEVCDAVCVALESRPGAYFMGEELSYVDVCYSSFLERITASLVYYKGLVVRGREDGRWAALDRWFDAMESRETYRRQKSCYYTHCQDLPPQLGGCAPVEAGAPYRVAIDGEAADERGWAVLGNGADAPEGHGALVGAAREALVYPRDVSGVKGGGPAYARLEAARSLISNHEAVLRFSMRGVAGERMGGVGAKLADPRATVSKSASEEQWAAADAALRHTAATLLATTASAAGIDMPSLSAYESEADAAGVLRGSGAELPADAAAAATAYLRARVGVPRDMSYPAARQLRAALSLFCA